jgi:intein-encoded DNA endonuclease-like protein
MQKEHITNRIIEIKRLFLEGYTPTMVSEKIGINRKNINYYIKKYNIKVINRFRSKHCNDNYFNTIDTEEKAYLLGFFIADGCISKDNRLGFSNSIDDLSVLELAKKEISPDSKIFRINYKKGAVNRKEQCRLRIMSNILTDVLINKYGILKNKTKDNLFKFNFDLIPENLHVHFIRGFFDGDGSVSFYETRNTIFFNFSFISTSFNFMNQIGEIFENKFKIRKVIKENQGKTINWFSMRFDYNRNRTLKINEIYEWLYKDATCFLERKKIKFENYLEYRAKALDNTNEQCNA